MVSNKSSRSVPIDVIFPNGSRRSFIAPTLARDALDLVFKDIEKSVAPSLLSSLWKWPERKSISAKSLFALSTACSPSVRNEFSLVDDEDIRNRKTCSACSNLEDPRENNLQFYFILKFYPPFPYKFSTVVAVLILQQLTNDITRYDYLIDIQSNEAEESLQQYLTEYEECILDLVEMDDQAMQLLADISSHPFYGFHYSVVQHVEDHYIIGLGLSGVIFCRYADQSHLPASLPIPFQLCFGEIDQLKVIQNNEGACYLVLDLKRGNVLKKKRLVLTFASKERLSKFTETFESIHSLIYSYSSADSSNDPNLELVNSGSVKVVSPAKASRVKSFTR